MFELRLQSGTCFCAITSSEKLSAIEGMRVSCVQFFEARLDGTRQMIAAIRGPRRLPS